VRVSDLFKSCKETTVGKGRYCLTTKGLTYSSVGAVQHVQPLLCGGIFWVCRKRSLESGLGDVPQLVMLVLKQDNNARALAIEGGGGVEDGVADNLLDLLVVNRRLLLEGVEAAAGLDGSEVVGRHGAGGLREWSC
jgi:hypothetical protein